MPQRDENRLIAWYLLIKDEWLPAQRHRLREWYDACREEPRLVWETPQVRYGVLILAGALALWSVAWFVGWVVPDAPPDARERASTANFHVVCSNPECQHHFLIERKFGFDDFPVICPKCGRETGHRALRCGSEVCGGTLRAAIERDGRLVCLVCANDLGPAP